MAFQKLLHRILFSVTGQIPQIIRFPKISAGFPMLSFRTDHGDGTLLTEPQAPGQNSTILEVT